MGCPTNQSRLQNIGNDLRGVRIEAMDIFGTKKITGNLHIGTRQAVAAKIINDSNEQIARDEKAKKDKFKEILNGKEPGTDEPGTDENPDAGEEPVE